GLRSQSEDVSGSCKRVVGQGVAAVDEGTLARNRPRGVASERRIEAVRPGAAANDERGDLAVVPEREPRGPEAGFEILAEPPPAPRWRRSDGRLDDVLAEMPQLRDRGLAFRGQPFLDDCVPCERDPH